MRVGIYNEPSGRLGGSEYLVSVMAHALARRHQVEIVHHNATLQIHDLRNLSGLELPGVTLRHEPRQAPPDPRSPSGFRHLPTRYRHQRAWQAALSRPYDLFITSTHDVPPFCHARRGVLLTLFPTTERNRTWPWNERAASLKARLRRACFDWMWERRFATYQQRFSISEYTRRWTREWWGLDTEVLYPPVDTGFPAADKSNLIISVGRFSTHSHSKRQLEMMGAYCDLKRRALDRWCYYSVGGLTDDRDDRAYFESVVRTGRAGAAHVVPNAPRPMLRDLLTRAKVFWHAAGYGGGMSVGPFEAEHFGIATVEAMAAGTVPVVFDQGGQTEIVQHGTSGFLWKTLDDLQHYTTLLATDEPLRNRMAAAARARAETFSVTAFERAVERIVG
jgi:glycosyltransferase involved in cell wall biosynthesis